MHQGSPRFSDTYRLGRALLPSPISAALCVCFSIALILTHLVLVSLTLGTALPKLLDGQWGLFYTNDIVRPLAVLSNSLTFGNALVIGLWGAVGLVVYMTFEFAVHFFRDWHDGETNIQMARGAVIRHPARGTFIISVVWRMTVLAVSLVALIVAQPVLRHLFANNGLLVSGDLPLAAAARTLTFEVIGWALAAHCFVVFWRLFLMRTRLFGDPEIT